MRRTSSFRFVTVLALALLTAGPAPAQSGDDSSPDRLVYADFQNLQDGRPVSARGGLTRLNWYAQNMANAPRVRGLENASPPAPAAARGSASDPNIAAAFEYELRPPNEWAGVNMEVYGRPDQDGKPVADDISAYKYITVGIFAKGPQSVRIELISRGQGHTLESGYPQATFRVKPGFQNYKLKLDSFRQPQWALPLNFKSDVLKKLTSVTIGVFCEKCTTETGTIVVDNIAFEK